VKRYVKAAHAHNVEERLQKRASPFLDDTALLDAYSRTDLVGEDLHTDIALV